MDGLEQKAKRLMGELKAGLDQIRKDAETMNLVHVTTKLKLANAVNLLAKAANQMDTYRPDETPDPEFDETLESINTFLTELGKSENNG